MLEYYESAIRSEIGTFALELARITGLIVVCPIPWEAAPKQVKAGLVFFLALVVHGAQASGITLAEPLTAALYILSEFTVGAAMGFVVRLTIGAAEIAGSVIAPIIGFGAAQVFDPGTGQSDSILTRLFRYLIILLALAAGLHRVVIGTLLSSFKAIPVSHVQHLEASGPYFLELSGALLLAGVRLALPVLAALLMVQVALGFVSRAAPAMQIFSVGFAVLLATGGVLMLLLIPDSAEEMLILISQVPVQLETLLMEVGGL